MEPKPFDFRFGGSNPFPLYDHPSSLDPGSKTTITPVVPQPNTHMRVEITRGQKGDFGFEISVSVDRPDPDPHDPDSMRHIAEDLATYTRFAGEIAQTELRYLQGERIPAWEFPPLAESAEEWPNADDESFCAMEIERINSEYDAAQAEIEAEAKARAKAEQDDPGDTPF